MFVRSLTLFMLLGYVVHAQKQPNFGKLKLRNEEIVFGVALNNHKIALVCKDTNDAYIVYRFGTADKAELTYPAKLDTTSWSAFEYYGYYRGGGVQNASMGEYTLTFTNEGVTYELYENWSSEDDFIVYAGINVTANSKTTDLKGNSKRRWESLDNLRFMDELMHNKWP